MLVLGKQRDLLAGIEQPANGEDRIILSNVGIEENRIAPVVDHRVVRRAGGAFADRVPHPHRRGNYNTGHGQATLDDFAVPLQPAVLRGLPAYIGIDAQGRFIAELHTHDTSGIIHVESPKVRKFTLGNFFDVWGLRFSSRCLGSYCATGKKGIWVWVNGRQVRTDPRKILLRSHQEIVVAFGTPASVPKPIPTAYPFPQGY